jgi:hypothetical protein
VSANDSFSPDVVVFQPRGELAKAIDYAKALNLAPHKWHAVPCGDGSIQLEQHTNGFDIEILVRFAGCADPDMIEVLPFTGEGGAA